MRSMTRPAGTHTGLGAALTAALLACVSCASLPQGVPYPSADFVSAEVTTIGFDAIGLSFDIDVTNPYVVELPLSSLDYELSTHERPFFHGTATLTDRVPGGATTRVTIPVRVPYGTLIEAAREIGQRDALPYRAVLGLHVAAPLLGEIRLPLEKYAEVRLPGS